MERIQSSRKQEGPGHRLHLLFSFNSMHRMVSQTHTKFFNESLGSQSIDEFVQLRCVL